MSSRDRKRGSSDSGRWDQREKDKDEHSPHSSSTPSGSEDSSKKPKMAIGFGIKKPGAPGSSTIEKKGIQMKLGGQVSKQNETKVKPKAVAAAFNDDSDSEPEEMPPEAKMRMRNIGRETPTSAGPNSFGKTKQGFCDAKKVFEKSLKQAQDTISSKS